MGYKKNEKTISFAELSLLSEGADAYPFAAIKLHIAPEMVSCPIEP